MPTATADEDGIPSIVEQAVCGFPDVANAINALPPSDQCIGSDYVNPALEPSGCAGCTSRGLAHEENVLVVPAAPLLPVSVPGQSTPDYPGTSPVVTPDVPGTGGQATPPVGQQIATITVRDAIPNLVCVDVTPQGGPAQNLACVARDLLGPADSLVPRGTTSLLVVNPPDVPPTLPQPVLDAPSTQPQPVPDVPGVPAGSVGSTPRITATIDAQFSYEPTRVTAAASLLGGSVTAYRPFGPSAAEAQWFVDHGGDLALAVSFDLFRDGVSAGGGSLSVPWLGQVLAAAQATAGTPP